MGTLINAMDTVLRIPSLFLFDEFLQSGLGDHGFFPSSMLPLHREADFDAVTGEMNHTLVRGEKRTLGYESAYFGKLNSAHEAVIEFNLFAQYLNSDKLTSLGTILETTVQIALLFVVLMHSIFFMTLWTKHLLRLYKYFIGFFLIIVSYKLNCWITAVSTFSETEGSTISVMLQAGKNMFLAVVYFFVTMALQSLISIGFTMCCEPPTYWLHQLLIINFTVPSFFLMLPMPTYIIDRLPFTVSVVPCTFLLLEIVSNMPKVLTELQSRVEYIILTIKTEGLFVFIESEWVRLDVSSIVKMFWISRTLLYLSVYLTHSSATFSADDLCTLVNILLVRGCETLPAILGLSSVFAWLWSKMHHLCQRFLLITNEDDSAHVGPVSAILFIIISLQNGISNLRPTARLVRLFRSICLLIACLLHFLHNAVEPVLMSLAASANPVKTRHIRALTVCAGLVGISVFCIVALWATHDVSTWLLAVTGFSVEVIFKVFISLTLYGLFLCDAKKNVFWAELDDHIYRVRLVGRAVEFLIGIFLLCNSAFILIFECGGAIRAVLVGLHAYFNLWCEARAGWAVFTRRRNAVRKICSLRTADASDEPEDVCAICFHEMQHITESVKVTPCKHYFHSVCLRKWLYVQERCPMCHQTLWTQNEQQPNPVPQEQDELIADH